MGEKKKTQSVGVLKLSTVGIETGMINNKPFLEVYRVVFCYFVLIYLPRTYKKKSCLTKLRLKTLQFFFKKKKKMVELIYLV